HADAQVRLSRGFRCFGRLARRHESLPAAAGQKLLFRYLADLEARHRSAELLAHFKHDLRVVEIMRSFHDRLRGLRWIRALENSRTDEDAFRSELHAQCGISGRRNAAGDEHDYWKAPGLRYLTHDLNGRSKIAGHAHKLLFGQHAQTPDLVVHLPQVANGLDDIAGTGLAFRANH